MPSSFLLGSSATFVTLLSLVSASPLTPAVPSPSTTTTTTAATDAGWNAWAPSSKTTTTSSKPADPSTWSVWDPTTSKTTTVTKSSDPAWGVWSTTSAITTPCPPALQVYTTKPCWTVDGKATCTEVVKTSTITDCKISTTKTTTPAKVTTTWGDWSDNSVVTTPCPPALQVYTTKPCWTVDGKPTCTEVVKTSTITDCKISTTKSTTKSTPITVTTTAKGDWNVWANDNGNNNVDSCGKVVTTTVSSCTSQKPVPTSSCAYAASCTTYHLETPPYAATSACSTTSSCTTYTPQATPVCANIVQALSYSCGTSSKCSTPAAQTTSSCSWSPWSSVSAKPQVTSTCYVAAACSTYHLETPPYAATSTCSSTSSCTTYTASVTGGAATSACSTVVITPTPVCSVIKTTSTITSTITISTSTPVSQVTSTATWNAWTEGAATGTGKVPASTGSQPTGIKVFTGAAPVEKVGAVVMAAAGIVGAGALLL